MMKNYIGTKFVQAEFEMRNQLSCNGRTMIVPLGFKPSPEWMKEYGFKPCDVFTIENIEGYKVRYADGYESWSPKQAFEDAYRSLLYGMDFGMALTCMKGGMRVTRDAWMEDDGDGDYTINGVTTYLALRKGYNNIQLNKDTADTFKMSPNSTASVAPYIQGVFKRDWLFNYIPTMEDLLASDWRVISDDDAEFSITFKGGETNE